MVPISYTTEQARHHLAAQHRITYDDSPLGYTTRARCSCGWRGRVRVSGFQAQDDMRRHLTAAIEAPIHDRAPFAVYREACLGCGGTGRRQEPHRSVCPSCWRGYRWIALDRMTGKKVGARTQGSALRWCEGLWRDGAGR